MENNEVIVWSGAADAWAPYPAKVIAYREFDAQVEYRDGTQALVARNRIEIAF